MKKALSIFTLGILLFTACTGVRTASRGLENESFLEFVGNPDNYSGGVEVTIDDKTTFIAEVNNNNTGNVKGKVYAISTGKHIVTVTYKNNLLVKKQIFVSAQETKKIVLP